MSHSSASTSHQPRRPQGIPVAYLIAGASTVVVVIAILIGTMSRGGAPTGSGAEQAAIKSAKSFMVRRDSAGPGLRVDKTPTAKRVGDAYIVRGQVGYRPAKGKDPTRFDPWEAKVRYDTEKKEWMVQDFKN